MKVALVFLVVLVAVQCMPLDKAAVAKGETTSKADKHGAQSSASSSASTSKRDIVATTLANSTDVNGIAVAKSDVKVIRDVSMSREARAVVQKTESKGDTSVAQSKIDNTSGKEQSLILQDTKSSGGKVAISVSSILSSMPAMPAIAMPVMPSMPTMPVMPSMPPMPTPAVPSPPAVPTPAVPAPPAVPEKPAEPEHPAVPVPEKPAVPEQPAVTEQPALPEKTAIPEHLAAPEAHPDGNTVVQKADEHSAQQTVDGPAAPALLNQHAPNPVESIEVNHPSGDKTTVVNKP